MVSNSFTTPSSNFIRRPQVCHPPWSPEPVTIPPAPTTITTKCCVTAFPRTATLRIAGECGSIDLILLYTDASAKWLGTIPVTLRKKTGMPPVCVNLSSTKQVEVWCNQPNPLLQQYEWKIRFPATNQTAVRTIGCTNLLWTLVGSVVFGESMFGNYNFTFLP